MAAPLDPACLFAVLADHEVEYVLIGGLAAVVRGSTAMTNDADIVPAHTPENLERLGAALGILEARLRSERDPSGIPFEPHPELLGSVDVLTMTTRCGDLDLTLRPAGIEDYSRLRDASEEFELGGTRVWVADLDDIIRAKEAAGRAKDRVTLPILYALREEIERGSVS